MKVLHVIPSLSGLRGGPTFVVKTLASHQARAGVEVHVAATDDAGRAFIARQHTRDAEGDGYSFVIAPESEPTAGIGSIGLWLQEIESGRASIGYWLVADARGHGLAAHALRAVVSFAFDALSIPRLHLFVEPWNVASARTAEAAGFTREATLRGWERIDGEQRDADCFALLHSQWARPD